MVINQKKLAQSLEVLHKLRDENKTAIRSSDLTRTHRERLLASGWIEEVIKGWYIESKPNQTQGDSTGWHISFWGFCIDYLNYRFGDNWCISPEQSMVIHAEGRTIPEQLLVRSNKGDNTPILLPHGKSLMIIKTKMPAESEIEIIDGLRVYSPANALLATSSDFMENNILNAKVVSTKIKSPSSLVKLMLKLGKVSKAPQLINLFESTKQQVLALEIKDLLIQAGHKVTIKDDQTSGLTKTDNTPPYCKRLQLMWEEMREPVISCFPPSPDSEIDITTYLKAVEDSYINDAYHSLSIEGYRVTRELIDKIRSGEWDPILSPTDIGTNDALAAKGYSLAFQQVKKSIEKMLNGENSGLVAKKDHQLWFREMFLPNTQAGILSQNDLIGYRTNPVYIGRSNHVPPNHIKVSEMMNTFFELLIAEKNAAVRVVLGHFIFVYIHPYMDGNGRIARFLMNLMLASGGYQWTVIPVEQRDLYMQSLETASATGDIVPFARFLGKMV